MHRLHTKLSSGTNFSQSWKCTSMVFGWKCTSMVFGWALLPVLLAVLDHQERLVLAAPIIMPSKYFTRTVTHPLLPWPLSAAGDSDTINQCLQGHVQAARCHLCAWQKKKTITSAAAMPDNNWILCWRFLTARPGPGEAEGSSASAMITAPAPAITSNQPLAASFQSKLPTFSSRTWRHPAAPDFQF